MYAYATIFLGKLFGFYFLLMGINMILNKTKIKTLMQQLVTKPAIYFYGGMTAMVLGLILVLSHNVWVLGWPILITLISYLILLKGLLFLFFPQIGTEFAKKMLTINTLTISSYIYIVLGLILLVFSFTSF